MGKLVYLDWYDWAYGLFTAIIGGGSGAVASAAALLAIEPKTFNFQKSATLFKTVAVIWLFNGILQSLAFLRTSPLPKIKTVVTTTQTVSHPEPKVKIVETVQETKTEPIADPKTS